MSSDAIPIGAVEKDLANSSNPSSDIKQRDATNILEVGNPAAPRDKASFHASEHDNTEGHTIEKVCSPQEKRDGSASAALPDAATPTNIGDEIPAQSNPPSSDRNDRGNEAHNRRSNDGRTEDTLVCDGQVNRGARLPQKNKGRRSNGKRRTNGTQNYAASEHRENSGMDVVYVETSVALRADGRTGMDEMPLNGKRKEPQRQIRSLRSQLGTQKLATRSLEEEVERLKKENEDKQKLLDIRATELEAAQEFLGAKDKCSSGDVLEMIQALNDEIFQTASFLSSEVMGMIPDFTDPERKVSFPGNYRLCENVKSNVGETILQSLTASLSTTIARFAFQTTLVAKCRILMIAFDCFNAFSDKALHSAYKVIKERESQSVFGRWRAMSCMEYTYHENAPLSKHQSAYLSHCLMDIFVVMGCQGDPMNSIPTDLQVAYWDHLAVIVKQASAIRNAIMREVTTTDIFPTVILPDCDVFKDDLMADAYEEVSKAEATDNQSRVACTIELGLTRSTKKTIADEGLESEKGENTDVMEYRCLLKPKIIRESLIKTL